MTRETDAAIAAAVDYTLAHDGGTFDARTLEPLTPATGYAVGIYHGTYGRVAVGSADYSPGLPYLIARTAVYAIAHGADAVGTWIDAGIVHVDPVAILHDRDAAETLGRATNQQSIWSFAEGIAIDL